MARQFIAGESPQKALKELRRLRNARLAFTVDLLGEYCVSEMEAEEYLGRYKEALEVIGLEVPKWDAASSLMPGHPGEHYPVSVSVKLSALYSQCYPLNFKKSVSVLSDRLSELVSLAKTRSSQVYVDAEDTGHNPIIYQVFKNVFGSSEFKDFAYPGIVLQAYAKDSYNLAEELLEFSKNRGTPIAIRLVKGAYWDSETVSASQRNWDNPLFTEKWQSDRCFEQISRLLLDKHELCLPAFGSHNVRSLVHACCYAKSKGISKQKFEMQMLYGMAEPIARAFESEGYLVRLYVPLGKLIPGMGYLVRRLLENTSNESFLKNTFYDSTEVIELLKRQWDE
jgi:RHH-type proline utilization regulon transcriptional repressor/proline dehydrogenase/delta 1-pyrroline-5-carboxylate dehydrogenase